MHVRKALAAAIAAAAGIVATTGLWAATGQAASRQAATAQVVTTAVPLPITHYSHMLVDPAHDHLFFSSGAGYSSILVTDYAGNTVATISGEPGATGLALSSDRSTVYAALANGDAVSGISTSTLAETARYPTGSGTDPTYVAYTSGRIWFGYGGSDQGGIGSIDPSTSTVTLNAAAGSWYAAPLVTATPGGELVAGEPDQSPDQIASYNVSSGTATVLAPQEYLYVGSDATSNLGSMQITPDGQDVVTASSYPGDNQVYRVSDLSADGTYTSAPGADSVSIAADGLVAAGMTGSYENAFFIFAPGESSRCIHTTSARITSWPRTGSRSPRTAANCSRSPGPALSAIAQRCTSSPTPGSSTPSTKSRVTTPCAWTTMAPALRTAARSTSTTATAPAPSSGRSMPPRAQTATTPAS